MTATENLEKMVMMAVTLVMGIEDEDAETSFS